MPSVLLINTRSNEILYRGHSLRTRSNNLMLLVAYMVWKRRSLPPNRECVVTSNEIVELLDSNREMALKSTGYRGIIMRIIGRLHAGKINILISRKGNVGPFVCTLAAVDMEIDLDPDELRSYLNLSAPSSNVGVENTEIQTALLELNVAETHFQKGYFYKKSDVGEAIFDRLRALYSHPHADIRVLSRLVMSQFLMHQLEFEEAEKLIAYVLLQLEGSNTSDDYLALKTRLYRAWLHFRKGEFRECEMLLLSFSKSHCGDRKLLADYYNLYGLVEREKVAHYSGREGKDFDESVKTCVERSTQFHKHALLLQMHTNDLDGIQNTCTSMAASYFFFVEKGMLVKNEDEERTNFRWLITSLTINSDFLTGGYSCNNAVVLAKAMLRSRRDLRWIKQIALEVGENASACFVHHETLGDFLEDKLKDVMRIGNQREQAYLLESLAFFNQEHGNEKKALSYGYEALDIFVTLRFTKRIKAMKLFLGNIQEVPKTLSNVKVC